VARGSWEIRRRTARGPSETVVGAEAPSLFWGEDHGEAKAQEGQVTRRDSNRDPATETDFHADQGLEDDEWCLASLLGVEASTPGGSPRLGREKANRREQRQEGMSAVTSRRGCMGGTNP